VLGTYQVTVFSATKRPDLPIFPERFSRVCSRLLASGRRKSAGGGCTSRLTPAARRFTSLKCALTISLRDFSLTTPEVFKKILFFFLASRRLRASVKKA
jgi:hypothetical protein